MRLQDEFPNPMMPWGDKGSRGVGPHNRRARGGHVSGVVVVGGAVIRLRVEARSLLHNGPFSRQEVEVRG